MLAGCSSSLVSPRHRLRSEASGQFSPSQSIRPTVRPVGLTVDKPIEGRTSSCSLKQSIRLPPLAICGRARGAQAEFEEGRREIDYGFWETSSSLKRCAEQGSLELDDESCSIGNVKRKRCGNESGIPYEGGDLVQQGSENFWSQTSFEVPHSVTYLTGLISPQVLATSEEEERVCFVTSEVIAPSVPVSNNPWVESIITEITDLGEKDVEVSHRSVNEASSGSSSSSESQGLAPVIGENTSEREVGNGSGNPYPTEGAAPEAHQEENIGEHQGFELVNSLVQCVEAISSSNILAINHFIARLGETASPRGNPIARLVAYYTESLALRVARVFPNIFHITPPRELDRMDDDSGNALRLLNQVSPIPKFIHFTANEMLLRAFDGKDRVHIIDFDIKQGLQWPSFFQSLASRNNPPSHVRITGVGESKQELVETGDRLAGFAEALNLPFAFHPVVDRLEDVRLWMLHVKANESVAVNCILQLHKMLYDASGGVLRDFLGLIRSTNPTVVIMAEQEAEHNDPSLDNRVCKSLRYYSALFDMLDSGLHSDSPVRIKIEEMLAREIRNIVACEESDRLERHDSFRNWKQRMEQGGLRCMGISQREMLQSQMLLKMYSCGSYSVKKQGQDDAVTLSWLDQPLYTVSAWVAIDIAGSSSYLPQSS